MAEILNIEEVMARDGSYVGTTVGVSMYPMLRNRRDTIVVRAPRGTLRKFDVALYKRGDGAYVLHRVVGFEPGGYIILGDNCLSKEHVREGQILGVLEEFWRGDAHCDPHGGWWMAYARAWYALWPARRLGMKARSAAGRVKRRVMGAHRGAE